MTAARSSQHRPGADPPERSRCKHVAMVVHDHYPKDVRVWRAARAACEGGWKVTVICLRHPDEASHEEIDGVTVRRLPVEQIVKRPGLWIVPAFLEGRRRRYEPPLGPWPPLELDVPDALLTVPGIWRESDRERAAFEREPLRDWQLAHPDTIEANFRHGWAHHLPMAPRRQRGGAGRPRVMGPEHDEGAERLGDAWPVNCACFPLLSVAGALP